MATPEPTFRVAGFNVHVPVSGFLGVGLLAYLWLPTFERAGHASPGLMALMFAVLLSLATLIHEFAHALVARRLGYKVEAVFLQFLGGVTIFQRRKDSPWSEAAIAAAGPTSTLILAAASLLVARSAQPGTTVAGLAGAMAWANFLIGIYNALPGLPLDGGNVLRCVVWALSGSQRRGTTVAAWCGRGLALATLGLPILLVASGQEPDLVLIAVSALLASMLWNGASSQLRAARIRELAIGLTASALARRAIPVPHDLPLAEALRRGGLHGAGALVIVDGSGRSTGIGHQGSIDAVPEQRRPWIVVSDIARPVVESSVLPGALAGAELLTEVSHRGHEEYLVLDADGRTYGVLLASDLNRALSTGQR